MSRGGSLDAPAFHLPESRLGLEHFNLVCVYHDSRQDLCITGIADSLWQIDLYAPKKELAIIYSIGPNLSRG